MRRTIRRRSPHRPDCRHCPRVRALGRDFRTWRYSWEAQQEQASCGYRTEADDFARENPAPTFKAYLIQMAGTGWPMSGQAPARWAA